MITTNFSLPINGQIMPIKANLFSYEQGKPMETATHITANSTWAELCLVVSDEDVYIIQFDETGTDVDVLCETTDEWGTYLRGVAHTDELGDAIKAVYRDMSKVFYF